MYKKYMAYSLCFQDLDLKQQQMDFSRKVDRISTLHDSILTYILSYLSTKDVVAISILSRRWRFLWTKVPAIDLDVEEQWTNEKKVRYKNSVNNVLFLNNEQCLRYCRLTLPFGIDSLHANAWIDNIVKRNVKELDLKSYTLDGFTSFVFTCEKLEVLTCRGYFTEVRPSVHLPNLRLLKLIGVDFIPASCVKLLISSCHALRELVIDCCFIDGELDVCSSTLKKLQLTGIHDLYALVIDARSLEYLMLSADYPVRYDVKDLASLKEADIDLPIFLTDVLDSVLRANILEFINSLASSTTLRLRTSNFLDPIFEELWPLEALTCLELPVVLDHTPNLVHLIIACHPIQIFKYPEGTHVTHVPTCLLRSIKVIEIRAFDGSEGAMEMVSYLLMSASVLNEMKIYWTSTLLPLEQTDIATKLRSLPRGSSACRVTMSSAS